MKRTPVKRTRIVAAAAVAGALLLSGCGGGDDDDAPRAWIASTYDRVRTDVYADPADLPTRVAGEIEDERGPEDRVTSEDMVFLWYDDDIVAVAPSTVGGSEIEVGDYDRMRSRYSAHLGRWPVSQSSSGGDFRGGGPGSGK
ncbi:DUF4247 domain-containing protein [Streptomyces radicis]|uniref:DUF4247 domain-containing protein n=1 Tax=Streptomyces radicis TaxID=1750517 RepID=UPI001E32F29E|nr:DUF4247 domain-containing protein [Streptomyces radicis]